MHVGTRVLVIIDQMQFACKTGEIEKDLGGDNWGVKCDDGERFQVPGFRLRPSPTRLIQTGAMVLVALGQLRAYYRVGEIKRVFHASTPAPGSIGGVRYGVVFPDAKMRVSASQVMLALPSDIQGPAPQLAPAQPPSTFAAPARPTLDLAPVSAAPPPAAAPPTLVATVVPALAPTASPARPSQVAE